MKDLGLKSGQFVYFSELSNIKALKEEQEHTARL